MPSQQLQIDKVSYKLASCSFCTQASLGTSKYKLLYYVLELNFVVFSLHNKFKNYYATKI